MEVDMSAQSDPGTTADHAWRILSIVMIALVSLVATVYQGNKNLSMQGQLDAQKAQIVQQQKDIDELRAQSALRGNR
jgi:cell division protein FtsL